MKQNTLTQDNQLALKLVQRNGMVAKYIYTPNQSNCETKPTTAFVFIRTARNRDK